MSYLIEFIAIASLPFVLFLIALLGLLIYRVFSE